MVAEELGIRAEALMEGKATKKMVRVMVADAVTAEADMNVVVVEGGEEGVVEEQDQGD